MDSLDDLFFKAFDKLPRLAPGSTNSSLTALNFFLQAYPHVSSPLRILDIGCGTGTHTLLLAERLPNAEIIALDNHAPYIEELNKTALARGLSPRVTGLHLSMFDMDFSPSSFDLIWAEGSLYIPAFQKGLSTWRPLLKPGAFLIASEISWLTETPSSESKAFWEPAYPEIDTIAHKLSLAQKLGYETLAHFTLPPSDWLDNYYTPLSHNLDNLLHTHPNSSDATQVVDLIRAEINLYAKHGNDYGYVFYILQKN